MPGKKAIKILAKHGFKRVRQKGSHVILKKTGSSILCLVPLHKELTVGCLSAMFRKANLKYTYGNPILEKKKEEKKRKKKKENRR